MTSKEALNKLQHYINGTILTGDVYLECVKTIDKDLERLEELEKDYEKLKERYKHRAEISNDLCKAVKQYEKAVEILKDNLEIAPYHNKTLNIYSIDILNYDCKLYLSQKQYELLKEVLKSVED